ncbi:MAG: PAS domain S-box protein, partial [Chloroflexi bacterium]|nr:PAS domain S-box protein [Chloroflexota bacterium]
MLEETTSRDELKGELAALRRRVADLEATNGERSRAELALRQSEDRLRAVVTNAPIVLFAVDKNGVFTISEGEGLKALGREQGEAVGQSAYALYADKPVILDNMRRALSGQPGRSSVEINGIAFDTHYLPLRDEGGEIVGAIGVATDVTERKRAEEAERQRNRELETLYTIARILSQPGTIEAKATQALEAITRIFEAEWAGLRLYDAEEDGLRLIASVGEGLDEFPPPLVIKGSEMMSGEAFRKGQPLIINDYLSYPNALPARIAQGVKSAVSMIIKSGDRPVGTINVNSKRPNHFTPQRVRFLSAVASGMGTLLDNASLVEAVRESEEKYRILFERSRDAIFISRDRIVIDANQAALDMFGYNKGEAIGFNTRDAYADPDDATRVRRELDEKGFVHNAEVRFRRKDGSEIECLVTITRRRSEDGEHSSDYGIVHDITERKRAEQRLRDNERRLQALVSALPVPVSLTRLSDGSFINVNDHLCELFGLSREELFNRKASEFYHDPADRRALVEELRGKGFVRNYEVRARKADGTPFWVTVSAQPFEFEGESLLMTAFYDTTERKRAEELFRTLAQSSPVGMFVIQDAKFSFVNNQFASETGFQPHELVGRDSLSLVHPDDRAHVRESSIKMLEGKLSNPFEFRGLDKNGGEFWLISTVA